MKERENLRDDKAFQRFSFFIRQNQNQKSKKIFINVKLIYVNKMLRKC